jgi:hypothetical protein
MEKHSLSWIPILESSVARKLGIQNIYLKNSHPKTPDPRTYLLKRSIRVKVGYQKYVNE